MFRRSLLWAALFLASLATAGPVAYYGVARMSQFGLAQPMNLLLSEKHKLQLSTLGQVRMLNLDTWPRPAEVRVLTLRQAEFAFYARVRYISHIDPRMVPFYLAPDVETAFGELRKLGITHVSIPEEPLPTLYNSFLEEITNSGRFIRRREHFAGATLCELFDEPRVTEPPGPEIRIDGSNWTPWAAVGKYAVPEQVFSRGAAESSVINSPGVSVNAREVRLSSGPGPLDVAPEMAGMEGAPRLAFGKSYLLEADIRGEGLVQVEVHLYVDDTAPRTIPVWQGYISGRRKPLRATFNQDAVSPKCVECETASARVVLRLLSRGRVQIGETRIRESGFAGSSSSLEKAFAERSGWALESPEPGFFRWGLASGAGKSLFIRHAGAYAATLESSAFALPVGNAGPEVSFEVRGAGRFFAELRCAFDERASAQNLAPDTGWLARTLAPVPGNVVRETPVGAVPAQSTAAAYASGEWRRLSVRLQQPDCRPLASGAVVSRLKRTAALDEGSGNLVRLVFITRWERDFRGAEGEMPEIEIRDISLVPGAQARPEDTVRL